MKHTHPFFNLFVITLIGLGAVTVSQFIGILFASIIFGIDLITISKIALDFTQPHFQQKQILWVIQGSSLLIGLGGGAFLYQYWVARSKFSELNNNPTLNLKNAFGVTIIFFLAIPVMAQIMQWNKEINFGDFDEIIRKTEADLEMLTKKITEMNHFGEFMIVLFVIAVIPAFAEEYFFRGLVQNEFLRWFKNSHIAVWVTGAIFSAVHFQFLGFFPRMILGALLGYVYVWSGNIFYPMLGHFINNGLQVLALYLAQRNLVSEDLARDDYQFPWIVTIFFGILLVVALHFFYKNQSSQSLNSNS
ncbi:MAG: CPBP family intramembrane glutamic endopeptidase [Raineya sp.]|nr:CPBP family intramembrane metalloprotease [Raineya sp.]MDW8295935.1 CPBP family intramembrane glutamic endopeptidase [Raineya sp.]